MIETFHLRSLLVSFIAGAIVSLAVIQLSHKNEPHSQLLPNLNKVKGDDRNGGDQPWSLSGLWYQNITWSSAKPTDPLIVIIKVDLDRASTAEQAMYKDVSIMNGTLRDARWEPQLVFMTANRVPGENKIFWAELYTNGELGFLQHKLKYQVFSCTHPAMLSVELFGTLPPTLFQGSGVPTECLEKFIVYPPEFGLQRFVDSTVW
eukprot:CAMPEP_0115848914 /NCGR_PEP_ID=MMETSP0287-20121206/11175_1 /TAXON_ID=412157 /ORGANISM="Chrysochromulina rotalis, Strain UIO044" /LENGTH=204 /DNA_ID=CAMNT_0003302857 /DNA_START=98 /DNA_END=709 /DNA_ORIENTATION=+